MREKPVKESADGMLVEAQIDMMTGGKSEDSIYRQEARGQRQLVMSDSIPTIWGGYLNEEKIREYDDMLRQLGFEIGEPFPDDDLFRPAKLPEGWKKSSTGHSMHSDIMDENGYARLGMFYKAAFYDRKANLHFHRRVKYGLDCREGYDHRKVSRWYVWAAGLGKEIILAAFEYSCPDDIPRHEWCKAENEAKAWLEEHYPAHMDPLAYWDQEFEGESFTYPSD